MNLGFDHLYKLSFEITESLRTGNLELGLQQFGALKEQYTKTIDALNEFVLENEQNLLGGSIFFVSKYKIISFSSCKFSGNEYNSLHKRRREEVQK